MPRHLRKARAANVEVLALVDVRRRGRGPQRPEEGPAKARAIAWTDMPVAGGGGTQAMTVLRARVTSGNPRRPSQMLGFDILDWAEAGRRSAISTTSPPRRGWDKVVPTALQQFSKYDGHWIAAPVNVHSTNWIWINKAVLDKLGGKAPQNWDELIALLDKVKAPGITPLAHGGQPWQDATIFDAVVLSPADPTSTRRR